MDTFNDQPYDDDFWPAKKVTPINLDAEAQMADWLHGRPDPRVTRFENYRTLTARSARRLARYYNPGFQVVGVTKIDQPDDDDERPGLYRVELWKVRT